MEEAREEEDLAASLESMSQSDKCYILLSNFIKDLASNTTKQFLGIANQIKALDDKLMSLDKIVHELGALVAHIKKDVYWTKAYLEKEAEEDGSENEKGKKEGSDSEKTESESENIVVKAGK